VNILSEGQSIRHQQYGMGTVTESNTDRTTIDFDDHGVKKFVTSIWSAELVGEAPAQPPTRRRGRALFDAKSSSSFHDRLRASPSPQPIFVCKL
jgi:hypothetical protein